MEMENSSRRSMDNRSRDPSILKKPRLGEDANGIRARIPTTGGAGGASAAAALVARFRERDDSDRRAAGTGPGPGPGPSGQQNHQELVSQYKTALAELTFNSKPIITNLTIIAGENLHAAKWIAGTVCANILEVPSDQKLPSLYLLDSIVKNIGRDYIKYFAARLPEVFCKAYRQVDSSIHPGMRHLFGTWKGVFPAACLQLIEKELGISPAINGSSSGATSSKSESQSQRPQHSIHVNPKYLEAQARQRLQQSNKAKGGNSSAAVIVPLSDDAERPDRTATIGGERSWGDMPMKMHDFKNSQRETSSEPVEKNSAGYDDYEYSSDLSRNSELGYAKAGERVTEQGKRDKPWYSSEKNAPDTVFGQRNAFDSQREISKYGASRSALSASPLQPTDPTQRSASSGRGMNKNWKNSEEEEYMWDDMKSRLIDRQGPDNSRRDVWTPDDAEKLGFGDHLQQPGGELDIVSRSQRESSTDSVPLARRAQTAFDNLTPSMWPLRETPARDGLKHMGISSRISGQPETPNSISGSLAGTNPSLVRKGLHTVTGLSGGSTPTFGSLMNTLSTSGILGQPRHQPLQPASPTRQLSILQHPNSPSSTFHQHQEPHNFTDEDHLHTRSISQFGPKPSPYVPQFNRAPQTNQNSFPIISPNPIHSVSLQNFQSQSSQNLQTSPSLTHFPQHRHHSPFSFQSLPELPPSQHSGPTQKPVPQSSSFGVPPIKGQSLSTTHPGADVPGQSSASSLLAAIVNSGLLSNKSVTGSFPNSSLQESGALASHLNNHPPLPSGPPPTQLATSSTALSTKASVIELASHASKLPVTVHTQRTSTLPPLPPGPPPPSSVVGTSSQTPNVASAVSNPLSGLLSSLVAKGLISTPAKEPPSLHPAHVASRPQDLGPGLTTNCSIPVSSQSDHSFFPNSSSGNEPIFSESAVKSNAISSPATTTLAKDLIGTEFKPEVIRLPHPSVISALFDDLPHQCDLCGLRLKLKERLDQHLEWHASRKRERSSCGRDPRKWYVSSGDWVLGTVSSSVGDLVEAAQQQLGPLVPADESQCVCLLCGELFEDFYSLEKDQWMYKDAAYLPIPNDSSEVRATDDGSCQGLIVHADCISPSSIYDLGLAQTVKKEQMDE